MQIAWCRPIKGVAIIIRRNLINTQQLFAEGEVNIGEYLPSRRLPLRGEYNAIVRIAQPIRLLETRSSTLKLY